MKKFSCPACGAEVCFQSAVTVFAVCKFCASMLVRHDVKVESIGKAAVLQEDSSPFQLGTMGAFKGVGFVLLGRQLVSWRRPGSTEEDGRWSEWYASFDDLRQGWLAEAQGQLMLSFTYDKPAKLPARENLDVGQAVSIGAKTYTVDDLKDAECAGSEGELPFRAVKGRKTFYADLSAPDGSFAGLEYSDTGTAVYVGQYVEFNELKLHGLRQLEGW